MKILENYLNLIEKQINPKEPSRVFTFYKNIVYNFENICKGAEYDPNLSLEKQKKYTPKIKAEKETENQDYQYEEKILKFLRNFPGNKKKYINPKDDMVEKFSISTPNLRDLKENDPKRLSYIEPQSRNSSSPFLFDKNNIIKKKNFPNFVPNSFQNSTLSVFFDPEMTRGDVFLKESSSEIVVDDKSPSFWRFCVANKNFSYGKLTFNLTIVSATNKKELSNGKKKKIFLKNLVYIFFLIFNLFLN